MLTTTLALFSAIALVAADPSYFIYPPTAGQASSFAGDIKVQRGSTINVQWYSNISSYTITLWQQAPSNDAATNWGTVYRELCDEACVTIADRSQKPRLVLGPSTTTGLSIYLAAT